MMNEILKQNWGFTVEYFEELAAGNKNYSALSKLVNELALSKYAEVIYPRVSVGNLNLSFNAVYESNDAYPTISIKRKSDANFIISYATNPMSSKVFEERNCNSSEVRSYLDSMFLRMEIETKEKLKTELIN
jgi:hypothetical protein